MVDTCTSSVNGFLTGAYTGWFPVVMAVALGVIAILSLLYILSPLFGRNDIKTWVKIKIFDVFVSIIFIMIFAGFATATCSYNPVGTYQQYGLLPTFCQSAQTINNVQVPEPNNLYSLSLCDLYNFNANTYNVLNGVIFWGLAVMSFWPSLGFKQNFEIGSVGETFMLPMPIGQQLGIMLDSLYVMQVFNEVQLILLACAPLLFAIFMSIGLIARMFGITRTFGSAMIAFGIGIGFVYPLLVSITYGFITTVQSAEWANVTLNFSQFYQSLFTALINAFVPTGGVGSVIGTASAASILATITGAAGANTIYGVMEMVGLMYAGILFIPLLNFVILDAFIVDFSQAVGERMSFMSLIGRLL